MQLVVPLSTGVGHVRDGMLHLLQHVGFVGTKLLRYADFIVNPLDNIKVTELSAGFRQLSSYHINLSHILVNIMIRTNRQCAFARLI